MKEILDDNESLLRVAQPVFFPFVVRSIPVLISAIGGAVFTYVWFKMFFSPNFSVFGIKNEDTEFPLIFLIFIFLPILQAIYQLLVSIFIYPNTEYGFTEKRVTIKSGFFGIDYKTIDYDQISDIEVRVNPIEKLFSAGTIKIYTGRNTDGERKQSDDIVAIKEPYDFFKQLKKTKTDIKTDWNYPNALRPEKNPGYQTKYDSKSQ